MIKSHNLSLYNSATCRIEIFYKRDISNEEPFTFPPSELAPPLPTIWEVSNTKDNQPNYATIQKKKLESELPPPPRIILEVSHYKQDPAKYRGM